MLVRELKGDSLLLVWLSSAVFAIFVCVYCIRGGPGKITVGDVGINECEVKIDKYSEFGVYVYDYERSLSTNSLQNKVACNQCQKHVHTRIVCILEE